MNLAALRKRFRQRVDDLTEPYLWSNEEADEYANEAVAEAAERALLLYDVSTPKVTQLLLTPDRHAYPLHPSIVRVDRVSNLDASTLLIPTETAELGNVPNRHSTPGDPAYYAVQGGTIMFWPVPGDGKASIQLAVYRLPLNPMCRDGDVPEIEARFHGRLIDWMAHRAYSKRDADAEDERRARNALTAFIRNFGQRDDADTQRKKAEHRRPVAAFNAAWGVGPQLRRRSRR